MGVRRHLIKDALLLEIFKNGRSHVRDVHIGQPAKAINEHAFIFDGGDQRKFMFFAKFEVFGASAGSDMYDASPFCLADFVPQDDLMYLLGGSGNAFHKFVEVGHTAGGVGCR